MVKKTYCDICGEEIVDKEETGDKLAFIGKLTFSYYASKADFDKDSIFQKLDFDICQDDLKKLEAQFEIE